MNEPEKATRDLQVRLQAMTQLKIFLKGLSQMSGLDLKLLAGMAAKIAEVAEKTGDEPWPKTN